MRKKVLACIAAVFMLFAAVPAVAFAGASDTDKNLTDTQKKEVRNYNILQEYRAAYDILANEQAEEDYSDYSTLASVRTTFDFFSIEDVIALIKEIEEKGVMSEDNYKEFAGLITEAEAAYADLDESLRDQVINYNVLREAREMYEAVKTDVAAVEAVHNLIAKITDKDEMTKENYTEFKDLIDNAKEAYENLDRYQARKVSADKKADLEKAIEAYSRFSKEVADDLNLNNATLKMANKVYTGKALRATVMLKDKSGQAVPVNAYTVYYKNNTAVGKATVTIKAKAGGSYTGSKSATFLITPGKAVIRKASSEKKSMKVVARKMTGVSGYKTYYKVKGTKSYKVVSSKSVTKTIKDLKKGKKYSVKVRTYKKMDGKVYYGKYSNIKTIKVK